MGPRGVWIAAVVVAFLYLILRPHFGAVYYLNAAHARMVAGGKASLLNSTSLGRSVFIPAASVGVSTTFRSERDCETAAVSYNANQAFNARCAQRTALLWGW